MQDEEIGHIFFLLGHRQGEIPQGQKGDQRHIVGNDHRSDKGDDDKQQEQGPQIARHSHQFTGQNGEEFNIPQSAHHRQGQEQAGQGLPIEIPAVFLVGGYQKAGDHRRQCGDAKHGIFSYKAQDLHVFTTHRRCLQPPHYSTNKNRCQPTIFAVLCIRWSGGSDPVLERIFRSALKKTAPRYTEGCLFMY